MDSYCQSLSMWNEWLQQRELVAGVRGGVITMIVVHAIRVLRNPPWKKAADDG